MRWQAALRRVRRWSAVAGIVALTVVMAPGTASAAGPWAGCPGMQAPPAPAAVEEGASPPAALPWPAVPVGGDALGTCTATGLPTPPGIDAVSYVVADLDSGAVLAARAPHARERPASTLKTLLALVAMAKLDPDSEVDGIASDLRVDGSRAGIGPGGRYTVRQLFAGLLLNSGNDTAEALARAMGGDGPTLAAMAAYARDHGALDTRPATPSGLDGPGMSASAYDLALLFRLALREPIFAETLGTRTAAFPGYGDRPGFTLSSTEQFAPRYPGSIGSKSGFTDAARHTLIAAARKNGRRLVAVLMRGEQRPVPMWKQAAALLDDAFAHPAAPAVGTLVEAPPAVPPTSADGAPVSIPPVEGALATGVPPAVPIAAGAVVLACLATGLVRAARRRRS